MTTHEEWYKVPKKAPRSRTGSNYLNKKKIIWIKKKKGIKELWKH